MFCFPRLNSGFEFPEKCFHPERNCPHLEALQPWRVLSASYLKHSTLQPWDSGAVTELQSDPRVSSLMRCGFLSPQLQVGHWRCSDSQGIQPSEVKQFLCILCRFCHGGTSFLQQTNRNVAINTGGAGEVQVACTFPQDEDIPMLLKKNMEVVLVLQLFPHSTSE